MRNWHGNREDHVVNADGSCLCGNAARWWGVALLLLAMGVCLRPLIFASSRDRLLWRAADLLAKEQYEEAERVALAVLEESPQSATALLIAGEAMASNHRIEEALPFLLDVPAANPAEYVRAQCHAATRLIQTGRARDAEACLKRVLEIDPLHLEANERLTLLLQMEGRSWESLPHAQAVVRDGKCGRNALLMIGGVDMSWVQDLQFVENCIANVPDDPLVLLGAARLKHIQNFRQEAEAMYRTILDNDATLIEAQVRLGEICLEDSDPEAFLRWHASLPEEGDRHPMTWYLRGLWAKRNHQPRAAARCFLEALRRHPNHGGSNFQLSQTLVSLGHAEDAGPFADRARTLSSLEALLHELQAIVDANMMRQVSEMCERLGRLQEAAGWCHVALAVAPEAGWARGRLVRLAAFVTKTHEFTLVSAQPALTYDLDAYPLPTWPTIGAGTHRSVARGPVEGNVKFVDMAAEAGLDFQYYNGTTATEGLEHILETTGGGIGVIDFDVDGWPDLYFCQGGLWSERGDQSTYRDRLFRNLGNGRFADVTLEAGLGDGEFSQGVAVGDYDGDGYPDLYLANAGPNRLYHNNGNGSFCDVSEEAGVAGDEWTTSAAMADLNGDGLLEIYAVNYLLTEEVLARSCERSGHPMGCSPTMFTAEQDRLYENLGNGRFRDVTVESGVLAADGKGLGIVAADFTGNGKINLFVGNDTTANFYFVNKSAGPGYPLVFDEQGILTGLAFNDAGEGQACMGIAAGDYNADGLLDLLIANFYADSNTLYRQLPEHMFVDESCRANLREPSFNRLGFGTQFIDADLDGHLDVMVSNGHVDRSLDGSVPDLMPPQFFRNAGDGRFDEILGKSLGDYFRKDYLGRSVVVLDWNRDGKEDLCVSHLDAPAALLTNRTPDAGHYLAVKLQGVTSNRDAIGTILELIAGGRTLKRQMIGGNGYMASSERKIIFGLANAELVDCLHVRWPSGAEQTFENLPADQELLIVEGAARPQRVGIQ